MQNSSSITLIGTVKHENVVTCIEWSPKGKQLVVGDILGHIKQYKPEMILVRVTPPPVKGVVLIESFQLNAVLLSYMYFFSQKTLFSHFAF